MRHSRNYSDSAANTSIGVSCTCPVTGCGSAQAPVLSATETLKLGSLLRSAAVAALLWSTINLATDGPVDPAAPA